MGRPCWLPLLLVVKFRRFSIWRRTPLRFYYGQGYPGVVVQDALDFRIIPHLLLCVRFSIGKRWEPQVNLAQTRVNRPVERQDVAGAGGGVETHDLRWGEGGKPVKHEDA